MKYTHLGAFLAIVAPPRHGGELVRVTEPGATPDDLIDLLLELDAMTNRIAAVRAKVVEAARLTTAEDSAKASPGARSIARRAFTSEIATALTISERAAENLIGVSTMLTSDLPGTLLGLSSGTISYRHAEIMVDHAAGLDRASIAELEQTVLPRASSTTPPRFSSFVRKAREALAPESIDERHRAAVDQRAVVVDEGRDGMAWLSVNLPAPTAYAIYDRLTTAALDSRHRRIASNHATAARRHPCEGASRYRPRSRGCRPRARRVGRVCALVSRHSSHRDRHRPGPDAPRAERRTGDPRWLRAD
jgi:hypothetical protein